MDNEYKEYKELNDDWINNFEKTDKLYKEFYKDDVYYINTHFLYINKNNNIEKIKKESFLMSIPNIITREEIIGILKKNSIIENIKYKILSILKYNITIDNEDISYFLKNNITDSSNIFLKPVQHIDSINFEKTINMFQDLNDLIFLFYEKNIDNKNDKINKNNTKKIFLKSNTNKKSNANKKQIKTI